LCQSAHTHIYAHSYTPVILILIDCMAPRVSLPTPKNENGVEWLRGEGFTLSVLTQHADRVADTHTHTHAAHPLSAGGFLATADAAATFFIGSVSAAHEHTHKQTMQTMHCFLSIYSLSLSLSHSHALCICVCVCESMSYISFIMCVCVCMCHGGLLYLWRAFR